MKKVILGTDAPGLGDQLQFSTLPEEFSKMGYDFYLSNKIPFRNLEIKQLVWGCNPFVKGETDEPPNAGEEKYCDEWKKIDKVKNNYIDVIESRHGINCNNQFPKIYYKFDEKRFERFKNSVIFDLDAMSIHKYYSENYNKTINEVMAKYDNYEQIYIQHKFQFNKLHLQLNRRFDGVYRINDIFEYCDIINICKVFVNLASGGNVLASAIRNKRENPIIETIIPVPELNYIKVCKGYYFENCNFIPII